MTKNKLSLVDNIGIVVESLDEAAAFFTGPGFAPAGLEQPPGGHR